MAEPRCIRIQAKIWRLFIENEPRIIQLGSFMNEPNKLRQLNRQIKEDCLTLHGFTDTDQLKRRKEQNNNTIFQPEFNLLHMGPNSPWIFGPRSCIRRFAACGALDKIRCVAIMSPRSDLTVGIQFESLRQYQNLEVVFIVTSTRTRSSAFGWKEKEWLRFREVDDERAATLIQYGRWYPPRASKMFTQERREQWQGMMARGPLRIAPRVVFVEEIRAWHEDISQ
jgi:hypothetical protein